jgi:hypothetical protein
MSEVMIGGSHDDRGTSEVTNGTPSVTSGNKNTCGGIRSDRIGIRSTPIYMQVGYKWELTSLKIRRRLDRIAFY